MKKIINEQIAVIRTDVLKKLLNHYGMDYHILLDRLSIHYGLTISYKSFARLLINKSEWKLIYAMILCDYFDKPFNDLFQLIANPEHG